MIHNIHICIIYQFYVKFSEFFDKKNSCKRKWPSFLQATPFFKRRRLSENFRQRPLWLQFPFKKFPIVSIVSFIRNAPIFVQGCLPKSTRK